MFSQDKEFMQEINGPLSQGEIVFIQIENLPPDFTSMETTVYLVPDNGMVSAYAPEDFGFRDEFQDSTVLLPKAALPGSEIMVRRFNMPPSPLQEALEWIENVLNVNNSEPVPVQKSEDNVEAPENIIERQRTEKVDRKSKKLDCFVDLTELAAQGKLRPLIGRDDVMERVILTLLKKEKPNPVLVGKAGVGKTAIVEGLAQLIVSGDVPDGFPVKRILALSTLDLMAGAGTVGEPEKRMKELLDLVKGDGTLLFIDEIHTLMDTRGALPMADVIKPMLAKGELRIIGATTPTEYRRIEMDRALARRLVRITVEEPSLDETKEILAGIKDSFQRHHGVSIDDSLFDDIVSLSYRHFPHRNFPDKAIELMDFGCAVGRTKGSQLIEKDHILEAAAKISGIPVHDLSKDEATKLLELESYMKGRIIGQDHAIDMLANALRAKRTGLNWLDTPIGFLFVGPTGVGKTEASRALAEVLFGSSDSLIRMDMSEYREAHTVSKLIGAPPGYVGYGQGGMLTEAVKNRPYSVVLFDEVEKAHPDLSNILLQILDYGNLTDSGGTAVSFVETIIILTCNVPYSALKGYFRPELLGRLKVVDFRALAAEDMYEIARIELEALKGRLMEREVELVYADEALTHISQLDSEYGARELKRHIDELIIQPLSYLLLKDQTQKIAVEVESGEITLKDRMEVTI